MEPTSLSLKEALPILKMAVAWLASNAGDKVKTKFQKWKNDGQVRQLARRILEITTVKTLWGGETAVSLYKFFYPLKVVYSEGAVRPIASLEQLGRGENYVIQGTAGQGKSIFLRFLTGQELRPKTSSGRIPIFVEMRRIQGETTLKQLLDESFTRLGLEITDELFEYYARSGRVVLLLDAFDEIEHARVPETLGYIETLAARFSELQIIVSSRPDSDIQRSSAFRVVKLARLTPADHPHFLRRVCFDAQQAKQLETAIKQSSVEIKGLLTTPLLLTLLSVIYSAQQTVPDALPGFYEQLFDVLFFKHDRAKAGFKRKRFTKLDDSAIKRLFEAFCFQARIEGKGVLSSAVFRECLQRALRTTGLDVDEDSFRREIVRTVCLMQEEGFDLVFIHKSVAEFHAAAFIRHSTDEIAQRFYRTLAASPRWRNWRQELRFLSEIDRVRFSKYFAIPGIEALADKLKIDLSKGEDANGSFSACDLRGQGPSLEAEGDVKSMGWSRKVDFGFSFYEDRAMERWLDGVSDAILSRIKSDSSLVDRLRRMGHLGDGPQGERLRYLTLESILRQSDLAPIVESTFRERVVRPLLKQYKEAVAAVRSEQEKLDLMTMLEGQEVNL